MIFRPECKVAPEASNLILSKRSSSLQVLSSPELKNLRTAAIAQFPRRDLHAES
ncbi:MAG: hypothetical protein VKK42_30245 [Lyngbya sp.]|nr:hypothetical protein [Lyngbya sp.]